jgi:sulfatase maturation enzyme AslB (radical SAM superfamily)
MSYETMDYAITTYLDLMKQYNQNNLTISIYGGETLINKKNLFKIIEKFGNNSGVNIYWIVNTNGSLLTEEVAEFFKKYNIDVHISCDGYENIHNKNRIDKFGNGTFKKVEKALELIKKINLKAQINSYVMPENINNLKDIVDIAKKYNINRIYLDLFYSSTMLDSKLVVKNYFDAYSYGLINNVKVHGPWTRVLNRYLNNIRLYYPYLPSINVNVDDTFFFNMYPMTRKFKLNIKNFRDILNSKEYPKFLDSVNAYFSKKCRGCYLFASCFGCAITQYQYHVIKKEGFEESCNFTREIIYMIKEKMILKNDLY